MASPNYWRAMKLIGSVMYNAALAKRDKGASKLQVKVGRDDGGCAVVVLLAHRTRADIQSQMLFSEVFTNRMQAILAEATIRLSIPWAVRPGRKAVRCGGTRRGLMTTEARAEAYRELKG